MSRKGLPVKNIIEKEGKPESVARPRDSAKSGNWSCLRMEEKLQRDCLSMGGIGKWPRVCQP